MQMIKQECNTNYMKKITLFILCYLFFANINHAQIFIATNGSDDSLGTIDKPYASFPKAISQTSPGDTIYVRGGVYNLVTTITINAAQSGTEEYFCTLMAYQDELSVLDFSAQAFGSKGISLRADYWHIKGLHITMSGDNGMDINSGSNNIIEQCQFYRNKDTGLQLSNGSADNQIINCDSYFNADPTDYGDADGFAPKLSVGSGNYFSGCRAWANVDDGWDGFLRAADSISTTLVNCWTWGNGYLENGDNPGSKANGNGFKMGGGDSSNINLLMHHFTLINCVAFNNKGKGFDQNNNVGSMTLYNCTSFNNLTANYRVKRTLNDSQVFMVKNCVSFDGAVELGSFAIQETNSWLTPFMVTTGDFISLDPELASAPRQTDGSLPDISLLHLAQGSDLIDGGVDLGYAFNGEAPDLGAFESEFVTLLEVEYVQQNFRLLQNYPNPFNPVMTIGFSITENSNVRISIYNVAGQLLEILLNERFETGYHTVVFNAEKYPSGIYFYKLSSKNYNACKKILLVK